MTQIDRRALLGLMGALPLAAGIGWFTFGEELTFGEEAFANPVLLKARAGGDFARAAIAIDAIAEIWDVAGAASLLDYSFHAAPLGALLSAPGEGAAILEGVRRRGGVDGDRRVRDMGALAIGLLMHDAIERVLGKGAAGTRDAQDLGILARSIGADEMTEEAVRRALDYATHRARVTLHTFVPVGDPLAWSRKLVAWEDAREARVAALARAVSAPSSSWREILMESGFAADASLARGPLYRKAVAAAADRARTGLAYLAREGPLPASA